ncbi:hypothetical protein NMG60_11021397 [Bertholletia excelsa]
MIYDTKEDLPVHEWFSPRELESNVVCVKHPNRPSLIHAKAKNNKEANDGVPKAESRAGRVLLLSDILNCVEANNDAFT